MPSPAPARIPGFSSSPITASRRIWPTNFAVARNSSPGPSRTSSPQDRQLQHRLPAVRRPDRAPLAGQPEHQAEFQRELLHHPRPRPRPSGYRQQQAALRPQPLAGGHARVPRRDDGVLPGDGGDDDAAGAAFRDGARPACRLFRRGLRRAELHDPADPLPAAPVARGQRVRLRTAYRQQLHHLPGAVELPGLEVRTAEGDWIRPPAVPGTFVVNTGAMLARYSNDRFRATPHRVINRNDRSRYAFPFFLGPNHDVVVARSRPASAPTTRPDTSRPPTAPSPSAC